MSKKTSPLFIQVNGVTYARADLMHKEASPLNIATFDPRQDLIPARKWVKSQLVLHRRVYRDTNDKKNVVLFATTFPDEVHLLDFLRMRFPKTFGLRTPKLIEVNSPSMVTPTPQEVTGPAITQPGRPLTVPYQTTVPVAIGSTKKKSVKK